MRFTTSALVLFGAIASSSASLLASRQAPPECAITCISTADFGTCSSDDTACLCANDAFVSSVTDCINTQCPDGDREAAFQVSQAACEAVGITLTSTPPAPTATSPSTTATTSTSTGAPTDTAGASSDSNAASSNGVNAIVGLAAVGLTFLAL